MHQWLNEWQALYEHVWEKPYEKENSIHLETLEKMMGLMLDAWISMDEKFQTLVDRMEEEPQAVTYESAGTRLFQSERFEEAAEALASERATGQADTMRELYAGFACLYANKLERAREHFLFVLQAGRDVLLEHFAHIGLGLHAVLVHEMEAAISQFEQAKSLTDNADVVYNLGVCYYVIHAHESAAYCFAEYAKEHREDTEALYFLGLSLMKAGRFEEGRGVWLKCAESLKETEALQALAHRSEWFGEHELACYCYEQMMFIAGQTQASLHGFAWNKALLGDERAVNLLASLGETDPEAHVSWQLLANHWQ
ncbi:hypothetical protein [Shouchella shacheensis]|uniref:hypothetical protein n=1 Tax=Shouchella shacheensis TaxID=1649580 RepID=UPI00073FB4B2|nr:hypothetical protein [Shouchella shacheensis]